MPRLFAVGAFANVLAGFCLLRIGLGSFYSVPAKPPRLASFFMGSVIVDLFIYDLPRGTLQHAFFYQRPFFLIQAWSAAAIIQSRLRSYADGILLCMLALSALYFLVKIYAAVAAGSGATGADYLQSPFALISQALGAMLIFGTGVAMLGQGRRGRGSSQFRDRCTLGSLQLTRVFKPCRASPARPERL